jgi:hypothetical protein
LKTSFTFKLFTFFKNLFVFDFFCLKKFFFLLKNIKNSWRNGNSSICFILLILKIICIISNIKNIIYGILIFNDKIYNMALKGLFRKKTVQDILKQVEKNNDGHNALGKHLTA